MNLSGTDSFGKVSHKTVWNKENTNSKTEERLAYSSISQDLKHPVGPKGFTEARGNNPKRA